MDWDEEPEEGTEPEEAAEEGATPPPDTEAEGAPEAASPPATHALQPLIDQLPPGLRQGVAGGTLAAEQALLQHFGGLHGAVGRTRAENRQLREAMEHQGLRFDTFMKKLGDTLGLELEEPQPPQDPLAGVHSKLDELRVAEEERQLDAHIAGVDGYLEQSRALAVQEIPDFQQAEEFVGHFVLAGQRQRALVALATRDYGYFDRADLQAAADGLITEDQLVERTASGKALDIFALTSARHFTGADPLSYARDILGIAVKAGWRPGGGNGAGATAPAAAPASDPGLARIRQQVRENATPARSAANHGRRDPATIRRNLAAMPQEDFDAMMESAEDPEGLWKEILDLHAAT
jgi:hypothetical protein